MEGEPTMAGSLVLPKKEYDRRYVNKAANLLTSDLRRPTASDLSRPVLESKTTSDQPQTGSSMHMNFKPSTS